MEETRKQHWADTHRQLWVSPRPTTPLHSNHTSQQHDDVATADVSSIQSGPNEYAGVRGEAVPIAVLSSALARECAAGGPISDGLIATIREWTATATDITLQNLAQSALVLHDKLQRNKQSSSPVADRVSTTVSEILYRINGERSDCRDEDSMEDNLYRILLEVEKCQSIIQKSGSPQEGIPLKEALLSSTKDYIKDCKGNDDNEDMLREIRDIIYAANGPSSRAMPRQEIPEHIMMLVRENEKLKRDYQQVIIAFKQYEDTVKSRFAAYGECNPPQTEGELAKLKTTTQPPRSNPSSPHGRMWLSDMLSRLDASLRLYSGENSPQILPLPDDAASVRAVVTRLLERVDAALVQCAHDNAQSANSDSTFLEEVLQCLPPVVRAQHSLSPSMEPVVLRRGIIDAICKLAAQHIEASSRVHSLCTKLRSSFALEPLRANEGIVTVAEELLFLEDAVAAVCRRSVEAVASENSMHHRVQQGIDELAQLLVLPDGSGKSAEGSARIEVPPMDFLDMVRLVRARLNAVQPKQAAATGSQSRGLSKSKFEDCVRDFILQANQATMDALSAGDEDYEKKKTPDELSGSAIPSLQKEPSSVPEMEECLHSLLERLRLIKSNASRTGKLRHSHQARIDMLTQQATIATKRLKKMSSSLERICEALGITRSVIQKEARHGSPLENRQHCNTPSPSAEHHSTKPLVRTAMAGGNNTTGGITVTESNLQDVLHVVEQRITGDEDLLKKLVAGGELDRLQKEENIWKEDARTFREAMTMVLSRLADSGRQIKLSLYMLGTDESPVDDVVESVIQQAKRDENQQCSDDDENDKRAEKERQLATILQKYTRWSSRLQETIDDHLYTQKKIVKYFNAVRRFFQKESLPESNDHGSEPEDENLIDIDSTLMRSADVILPALDSAIRQADGGGIPASAAVAQLAAGGGGAILPYDHRLGRLHELINKLHNIVTSLQRVRYLSIPSAVKQRSSGENDLLFDSDTAEDGFVELDLEKLLPPSGTGAQSQSQRFARDGDQTTQSASVPAAVVSPEQANANNDIIMRVATQNVDCLHESLRKFSASHKLAAILIQKDMDTVQQQIVAMLERYSELDIEQAFGQDRHELKELHSCLSERGIRQKGCYFFNRVNGEGPCLWASALEPLAVGFGALIDKLVQRTSTVSSYREMLDEITDLCAMYVSWSETVELPKTHPMPDAVVDAIVRDGDEGGDVPDGVGAVPTASQLPPLPTSRRMQQTESSAMRKKVSHFRDDMTVLRVIQHMFQLSQEAVTTLTVTDGTVSSAPQVSSADDNQKKQNSSEEVVLCSERAKAAETRALAAESERDHALSEAALAKAELRRWKRQNEGRLPPPPAPVPRAESPTVDANLIEQDCLHEVLQYMKALSGELQYANAIADRERLTSSGAAKATPDPTARAHHTVPDGTRTRPTTAEAALVSTPRDRHSEADRLQHQLKSQYGNTTLQVVAGPTRPGYAAAIQRDGGAGARYKPGDFSNSIVYDTCDTCIRHHQDSPPTARRMPPRLAERILSAEKVRASGRQQNRTPSTSRRHGPHGKNPSASEAKERFIDDGQWLQDDTRLPHSKSQWQSQGRRQQGSITPRRRDRGHSPKRAPSNKTPRGKTSRARGSADSPPAFDEALRTIDSASQAQCPEGEGDVTSRNANLRAAALRRLAEVVTNTKVRGQRRSTF